MPVAQKLVGGLVLIALVTTMILPGRQTPRVIDSVAAGGSNLFKAAMATG
jgi:hypothetical protein